MPPLSPARPRSNLNDLRKHFENAPQPDAPLRDDPLPVGRTRSYVEAVREATDQEMERDPSVVVFGLDVDDPKAIQGTTRGLRDKHGAGRVFGTPLSEDAMTGAAIGMALAGLRPIHVHIRMDFLMLAMNQLVNVAAKSRYMYGGTVSVPLVVRSMIGKSWGQGAQHSQGLYSFFMHVPGLKVVAPATPYDAKGCLIAAIRDDDPVLYVEHRLLHFQEGPVPDEPYTVAPGRARITAAGGDVTLVGISQMQVECLRARAYLDDVGIRAEVIDPIWLSPLDVDTVAASVAKTGRLLVVDNGWVCCGASAEIVSAVAERLQGQRDFRLRRMGFAPSPCPTAPSLEDLYYPNGRTIAAAARDLVEGAETGWLPPERPDAQSVVFKGPF
jgi:pyruvate/2-oxoglutarate/acetoin dehydrogenase E1 component